MFVFKISSKPFYGKTKGRKSNKYNLTFTHRILDMYASA